MKSGELVEDGKVRDNAGYQIRLKPQVLNNEGRRVCRKVEEVVGSVGFLTATCRDDGFTDGSSLF